MKLNEMLKIGFGCPKKGEGSPTPPATRWKIWYIRGEHQNPICFGMSKNTSLFHTE